MFVPLCPAFSPNKEGKHFSYKTVGLFGLGWGNLAGSQQEEGTIRAIIPLAVTGE